MSNKIADFVTGKWVKPKKAGIPQFDAINGSLIGEVNKEQLDFAAMMDYARTVGGPALRKMTFQERGLMLKKLALHLHGLRKSYYPLSYQTGATKTDSWIDIDGGIGTLFTYASLRRQFGNEPFFVEGETVGLSKQGTFVGTHILTPKQGVAIHINAFNFPIWGMLEKIAPNLLAGMPAIVKASELTSFLTQAMVKDIIASGILPKGALQLVCGSGIGILEPLINQDVVTFTGSAATGRKLKAHHRIIEESVPFNLEADSLNAAVLGPDVEPNSEEFKLFIREVRNEMTTKAGQKCTAIRRIIVPASRVEVVRDALSHALGKVTVGDPQKEGVRMGALVARQQVDRVRESIAQLKHSSEVVFGDVDQFDIIGGDSKTGAFCAPTLLLNTNPLDNQDSHNIEAFGPVSTIMPYRDLAEAGRIANLGKGSLVSTVCTYDTDVARQYIMDAGAYHGRILILNRESAPESTGHGAVMPGLVHGGPGRAGGGEEQGGVRGVKHYLQRTALQGHPTMLSAVTQNYQYGGKHIEKDVHPFRKHFEELEIGETVITHKHTVTTADIVNFANVSGDNFYAHVDETSLDGTIFEGRVAHGYFVLAKAAGLFVEPKKGPVLLNYGIDSCRFTKPVYPGMTIGVRFTVKEKIAQEKKDETDIAKGIVKFLVDVYDETGETVALATILTMVKMLDQGEQGDHVTD